MQMREVRVTYIEIRANVISRIFIYERISTGLGPQ